MKSPVTAVEVRWRLTGRPDWQTRSFLPGARIELRDIGRGDDYDIEARNVGVNGLASPWVSATVSVPNATPINEQVLELDISGGGATINGRYRSFRLTLTENVTIAFANIPPAWTGTVEIEQWGGGGHTVTWPSNVVPTSGVPHQMSAPAGATDLVSLTTTNGGASINQTVFKAGVAFAGVIAPSPATGTSSTDGTTPSAPSVQVVMTTTNGTAPITYAWVRETGSGTAFDVDDDTAEDPVFSIPAGTSIYNATQRWRCTATDADGRTCQAAVNATLARTASGGGAVTIDLPATAFGAAVYPNVPSALVTATVGGTPGGMLAWSRIDANGGSNFAVGNTSGYTYKFSSAAGQAFIRTQTWRLTDPGSGAFDDVEVSLERAF